METIILNTVIVSCIVSALFVMIRVYFCYFAKRNCSNDCECGTTKNGRIGRHKVEVENKVETPSEAPVYKEKTTRPRKLKAEAPAAEPVKKKPGRKKKS